jgi:acetyl-CoA acetyltransferase
MTRQAVIVDAVRTPLGRRDGMLKAWHPVDLLGFTLNGLVARNKLDPARIDDVIAGCVMQVGEQTANVGRNAVLAAGFPESVPGTTVDRQCGSSQQAIHFAAQGVIAGSYDIAIGCGVESMTRVPMGASAANGPGKPFGPAMMSVTNSLANVWINTALRVIAALHALPRKAGSAVRFCRCRLKLSRAQ